MQIHVKTEEYREWYVTYIRECEPRFCIPRGKGECAITMVHPAINISLGLAFCKAAESYGLTGWEYRMDTAERLFYAEINDCTCAVGVSILHTLRDHASRCIPESYEDFRYTKLLHARTVEEDLSECTIGSRMGSYPFTEHRIDFDSKRSEMSLYRMRDKIQKDHLKLCRSMSPYYER
jgi:hypothetical protein